MITYIQTKLGIPTMREIEAAIIEVLGRQPEQEMEGYDLWISVSRHLGCKRQINIGRLYSALFKLEHRRVLVGSRVECGASQIRHSRYKVAYLSLTSLGRMFLAERA